MIGTLRLSKAFFSSDLSYVIIEQVGTDIVLEWKTKLYLYPKDKKVRIDSSPYDLPIESVHIISKEKREISS